jgi:hypothetical protein
MQTIKAFNYPIKIRAQLVIDPPTILQEERFVYSRPITVFQGVQNNIKIWFLNTDQKPVDISNISVTFNLFTPATQYQWLSKPVNDYDSANGVAIINLLSSDLAPLALGFYEVGMTATSLIDSSVTPVYLNDNYQGRLSLNLEPGPVSALTPPIPVTFTDTSHVGVVSDNIDLTVRPSGNNNLTFGANLILPYTGNIVAQASMVTNPVNADFGNVVIENYSNVSGPIMFNVPGTFAVMRFLLSALDPNGNGNVVANNYITSSSVRY